MASWSCCLELLRSQETRATGITSSPSWREWWRSLYTTTDLTWTLRLQVPQGKHVYTRLSSMSIRCSGNDYSISNVCNEPAKISYSMACEVLPERLPPPPPPPLAPPPTMMMIMKSSWHSQLHPYPTVLHRYTGGPRLRKKLLV